MPVCAGADWGPVGATELLAVCDVTLHGDCMLGPSVLQQQRALIRPRAVRDGLERGQAA